MNDEPFTDEFKTEVRKRTRAATYFGLVPSEHWSYPDFIDQEKARQSRIDMDRHGVPYATSESYRHMCRFQSGFFFEHPLTYELGLEYYWRVEPYVQLNCDIDYDPFMFMKINNKAYGFTITLIEYEETIPTLWDHTKQFMKLHPDYFASDNLVEFVIDNGDFESSSYNLCHFWSNFEIGDINFFRSRQYKDYFEYLDKTGGFFYERWGDAPVHSIAASLFLNKSQVYHFKDIGYVHDGMGHCPLGEKQFHENGRCNCNVADSVTLLEDFCMGDWWWASREGRPSEREEYQALIDELENEDNWVEDGEGEEGQEDETAGDENSEVFDRRHIKERHSSRLLRQKRRARMSQQRNLKKRKWLSRS
mgnify:FL=1